MMRMMTNLIFQLDHLHLLLRLMIFFNAPTAPYEPLPVSYEAPSIFNDQQLTQQQPRNNPFESAPVAPGEQVTSEIELVVEKAKEEEEVEKITPTDPLLEYFNKADKILKTDFVWQKEQEKAEIENFKKDYEIDTLSV